MGTGKRKEKEVIKVQIVKYNGKPWELIPFIQRHAGKVIAIDMQKRRVECVFVGIADEAYRNNVQLIIYNAGDVCKTFQSYLKDHTHVGVYENTPAVVKKYLT